MEGAHGVPAAAQSRTAAGTSRLVTARAAAAAMRAQQAASSSGWLVR